MKEVQHHHVYLATDEPAVVAAAQEKYAGNHTFHANVEGAEAAKTDTRYSDASLRGLIQDVFALARADFLVRCVACNTCGGLDWASSLNDAAPMEILVAY